MKSSFFALLFLVASAPAELSLTPRVMTLDFGGNSVRRAYFMDGVKKFAVTIDTETELSVQGDGAIFRFIKIPLATVELHRSPLKAGVGFSQENISEYAKAARQFLVPAAELWPEEPIRLQPLPINGWESCRINFFYRVGGSSVRADVTFIDLDGKNQIVVITGAAASSYTSVRSRSDDIIRRWHLVTPEEEAGVN